MNTSFNLLRVLRAQAGVVSRSQALGAGLTPDQIDYRLVTGEWIRVHPRVYRLAAAIPSAESSLRAAALWVGPHGALMGRGAAWWWGMSSEPPPSWRFATDHRINARPPSGVQISRCFVDPFDLTTRQSVPVVSRPLAVLQSAVDLERGRPGSGISLIDRAKQKRWVSQADLEDAYERHRGTRGSSSIGLLLTRTGDRAHSELERAGVRQLHAAGITGFVLNYSTMLCSGRSVELDVAFVEQQVALEFDGYAYHSSPEAQRADLRRANDIMASGWLLRRFTWSDVLADPGGFIRAVRASLDQRSAIA